MKQAHYLLRMGFGMALVLAGCEVAKPPANEAKDQASQIARRPKPLPAQPEIRADRDVEAAPVNEPRRVFVHMMVSFRTRQHSGVWSGWDYSNQHVRHRPDRITEAGQRDIAAAHYPRIGPYDMTDPQLVEYHCQSMKLAGLDGIFFDVPFYNERGKEWVTESVRLYVETMRRYGLSGAVIYEDKCHWAWNPEATTREEAVRGAHADMSHWLQTVAPVQATLEGRPLLGFFSYEEQTDAKGVSRLLPDEVAAWKNTFPEATRPILITSWFKDEYQGALDGSFDWIWLDGERRDEFSVWMDLEGAKRAQARREGERDRQLNGGIARLHVGGVWAGFDSRGCWGWDGEPQYADRANGALYQYQWERILKTDVPIVQVVTWNDWFEGSEIEPSVEYGYQYLEMTRRVAARYKGVDAPDTDLTLAENIYRLRKSYRAPNVLAKLDAASALIAEERYQEAGQMVAEILAQE